MNGRSLGPTRIGPQGFDVSVPNVARTAQHNVLSSGSSVSMPSLTPARAGASAGSSAGRFQQDGTPAQEGARMRAGPGATPPPRSWIVMLDGQRLRQLRRQHGLSQEKLADLADVSLTTVARLERRPNSPCRGRTLARLAAALGEEPAAILATTLTT